jgi:hypothetical protein
MAWGKRLPKSIRGGIDQLKPSVPPPPDREVVYKYLRGIYDVFCSWRTSSSWKTITDDIHRLAGNQKKKARDYFGFIIDRSSTGNVLPQQKSKYLTILVDARKNRMTSEQMVDSVKKAGGINKAVEEIRNPRRGAAAKKHGRRRTRASAPKGSGKP